MDPRPRGAAANDLAGALTRRPREVGAAVHGHAQADVVGVSDATLGSCALEEPA